MAARVTDEDLVKRCYARTHEAADKVSALDLKVLAAKLRECVARSVKRGAGIENAD